MHINQTKLKRALLEGIYPTTKLLEFFISARTARERNISEILTDVRALVGVVTVSFVQPTRNISDTEHITLLKIKYAPGFSTKKNIIRELFYNIKKINGVNMIKIMKKKIKQDFEDPQKS